MNNALLIKEIANKSDAETFVKMSRMSKKTCDDIWLYSDELKVNMSSKCPNKEDLSCCLENCPMLKKILVYQNDKIILSIDIEKNNINQEDIAVPMALTSKPCRTYVSECMVPEKITLDTNNWAKKNYFNYFRAVQLYSIWKRKRIYAKIYIYMGNYLHIRATPNGDLEGSLFGPSAGTVPYLLLGALKIYTQGFQPVDIIIKEDGKIIINEMELQDLLDR